MDWITDPDVPQPVLIAVLLLMAISFYPALPCVIFIGVLRRVPSFIRRRLSSRSLSADGKKHRLSDGERMASMPVGSHPRSASTVVQASADSEEEASNVSEAPIPLVFVAPRHGLGPPSLAKEDSGTGLAAPDDKDAPFVSRGQAVRSIEDTNEIFTDIGILHTGRDRARAEHSGSREKLSIRGPITNIGFSDDAQAVGETTGDRADSAGWPWPIVARDTASKPAIEAIQPGGSSQSPLTSAFQPTSAYQPVDVRINMDANDESPPDGTVAVAESANKLQQSERGKV